MRPRFFFPLLPSFSFFPILLSILLGMSAPHAQVHSEERQEVFLAGTHQVDITPTEFPVLVNAMFTERVSSNVADPLHVRALALDDGSTRVVMAAVDSCMVARDLLDRAKDQTSRATGIPTDRMLISCTHTHSAPSAMGCLGSRMDTNYARWLEPRIAEAMVGAVKALTPAQVGWGSFDAWDYTFNRRWIRRPDRILVDPFGQSSARAHMHPGHQSPDAVGPSGPVDPAFSLFALRKPDGAMLAVFANFSQHYYGSPLLSSDYFGRFCGHLTGFLRENSSGVAPGFLPLISQGTSGDLMWMDYSAPARDIGYDTYARELAEKSAELLRDMPFKNWVPLRMAERTLKLDYRVPDPDRLAWAYQLSKTFEGRLPATLPEVYALEAIHLHNRPHTELKLQALALGDLGMTAIPNEVYALTGLKLKAQSPLPFTFNIELANGAEGYIPPPEQHALGGYTTWPARTAGLEVQAEPKIVETLTSLLEEVSGRPRSVVKDQHGPYALAVLNSKPSAFWRLNEMNMPTAFDATSHGRHALLENGVALYLPGASSMLGFHPPQLEAPNAFSGEQINRAIHFAGGRLRGGPVPDVKQYTVEFWFWNGLPTSLRPITGHLFSRGKDGVFGAPGEHLALGGTRTVPGRLVFSNGGSDVSQVIIGRSEIPLRTWNHLALVRDGQRVILYLNGDPIPELAGSLDPGKVSNEDEWFFGGRSDREAGFEGKLDEIAWYERALPPDEIKAHFTASGLRASVHKEDPSAKRPAGVSLQKIQDLKPLAQWLSSRTDGHRVLGHPTSNDALAEDGVELPSLESVAAQFRGGRLRADLSNLPTHYSAAFWFRNDLALDSRPVTAYLFSRGVEGDPQAPGDHLGIGGTHSNMGRLIWFNGNQRNELRAGTTPLAPKTWHQVILIREGAQVRVYLDGSETPELEGELEPTFERSSGLVFFGGRSDRFANLQGMMSEISIFDRALRPEEIQKMTQSQAPPSSLGAPSSGHVPAPSSQPISPEDSLSKIHVPKGFQVELAASEPLLESPVAIDWDEQGRLWVLEMVDYPLGLDGAGKPGGRVRFLEDIDGDGRYDHTTLFADGLSFPTGILSWRDGVIITAAPEILFLKDSDGDGLADVRNVLFSGFFEGNQQLRVNGLRWGIDNWVYCASGAHYGGYGAATQITSHINGQVYSMGSRDFRFNPDTGVLEPQSGPSQYGRNPDDWGHWFGVQNSWPLWHYVLQDHYLKRNPHTPSPDPRQQIITPSNPKVYPASQLEQRFHSFGESGHFTSACSAMIYRDDILFASSSIRQAFTCEPFHNLVQHFHLTDEGVSFRGVRADDGPLDFFASEDRWCRPVMVRTGPDGALWVVDMYRYMIEHPEWLPPEGKAQLLPHYRLGEDRGRIYRVVPEGGVRRKFPQLASNSLATLVTALGSPNGWVRDKSQMMLLWRNDPAAVPLLKTQFRESDNPLCRLHTLSTLDGLGALNNSDIVNALHDPHPGVRLHGLRLAEKRDGADILAAALPLVEDPDPKVRLQLAFSLGQWSCSEAGDALGRLAVNSHTDPFMKAAVLSSALPHTLTLAETLATTGGPALDAYSEPLLQITLGTGHFKPLAQLLEPILTPTQGQFTLDQIAGFSQFLDLLTQNKQSIQTLLELPSGIHDLGQLLENANALFDSAFRVLSKSPTSIDDQIIAARLLLHDPRHQAEAFSLLGSMLIPRTPQQAQRTLLQVLGQTSDLEFPKLIATSWASLEPDIRNVALDQLQAREPWAFALVQHIESGALPAHSLDAARRARLLNHPSKRIKALASKVLHSEERLTRPEVLATYQPALKLKGQPESGKAVFGKLCAACHRLNNDGNEVGPNLQSVSGHSREKLLTSILDPNASIEPGYTGYTAELSGGKEIYGLIVAETENSLIFKQVDGTTQTLLRRDISRLQSTNLSLMPEGLEAGMSVQELADLLALLQKH